MLIKSCIIGYPAKHSRSPLIHNYWIKKYSINGIYEINEIMPSDIYLYLNNFKESGYVGANITIPYKETVFNISDVKSNNALRVGAANTIWIHDGILHCDNTDVDGFLDSLDNEAPGWDEKLSKCIVLGAGGAARAVIFGLLARGARDVVVVNRSISKAEAIASTFQGNIRCCEWDKLDDEIIQANFIVNTTSLGMKGQPSLDVKLQNVAATAVVCDIVYLPLETEFIVKARAAGLRAVGGLGMLLHQAAPSFEKWFHMRPEITPELRQMIEADVRKS